MLGVSELTELAIEAINGAVEAGVLLIRGETGVKWDEELSLWVTDDTLTHQPACDVGGALLLWSPQLGLGSHGGDIERALRCLIAPECDQDDMADLDSLFRSPAYEFMRNFFHGWDNIDYVGGHEDAYNAGFSLAKQYHPLDFEVILASRAHQAQ